MPTHLFIYGSLLFDDVFEAVTGVRLQSQPATLREFGRYRVAGASYPAIVPEAGASTTGAIILDVDLATIAALDRFEGDMYERCRVQVMLPAGGRVDAETYVFVESARRHLTGDPWKPEEFGPAARAALAGTDDETDD